MPFAVAIFLVFSQIDQMAIIFYPDTSAMLKVIESLNKELDQTKYHIPLFYRAEATVNASKIDSFVKRFNVLEEAILQAYTVKENPSFKNVREAYQALINMDLPPEYEEAQTSGICIAAHNIMILNHIAEEMKEGYQQPIPLQMPPCQDYRKIIKIAKALQAQGKRSRRGKRSVMPSIERHNPLGVDIAQLKLINFIFRYPVVDDSNADKISFPENLSEALEKSDIAIKLYMLGFYENFIYVIEKSRKKDSSNEKQRSSPEIKFACARILNLQKDIEEILKKKLNAVIPDICQKISMSKGHSFHAKKSALSDRNNRRMERSLIPAESKAFLYEGITSEKGIEIIEVDSTAIDTADTTHTGGAPWKTIR